MSRVRVAFVDGDDASQERAVAELDGSFEVVPVSPPSVSGLTGRERADQRWHRRAGGWRGEGHPGDGSDAGDREDTGDTGTTPPVDCVVVSDHGSVGEGAATGGGGETAVLSLLRAVRESVSDLPVVVFTANGSEVLADEALRAGAADYVTRTEDGEGWTVLGNRVEHLLSERRAATRLAQNEGAVSTLVGNLPGVVYRVLPGGEVAFLDGDVEGLTGHTREAFDGEVEWWDVVHPSDRDRARAAVDEALAAREPFEVTYRLQSGDGVRWVTDRGRGVFADGDLEAVEGVLTDVTERRRRDRQVRDLHAATRRLVAAESREEIARVTAEAASDVLGYSLNGVRLLESVGDGDHGGATTGDVATDLPSDVVVGTGGAAGTLVPVTMSDATAAVLGDRPDYPVDGESPAARALRSGEAVVVDDVTDIDDDRDRGGLGASLYLPLGSYGTLSIGATEPGTFDEDDRRLAELLADNAGAALAAVARREALANERDRLAALFENVPEPTIRVTFEDGEPFVEEVNPAFEATFGIDEATVRGRVVDEFIVPPDDRDRAREFNQRIQAGEAFDGEVRRLAADGPRDFLLHVVPRELDPETTEGFAIYTDITDRKARERELERQNERLEEFAGVVSHDLRNPLNVAAGRLELYREDGDPAALDDVAAAHGRIRERIEDLLELARQGRTVDDPGPVPLDEAARAAWDAVEVGAATLALDTDGLVVRADRSRLEQLLENLFANALEHGSPPDEGSGATDGDVDPSAAADGGHDLTVTVGRCPGGFSVADDGVGIPDGVRDELFDSGVSTATGTGFGLAIVQSIAEAHGWTVRATDAADGGARFEFTGITALD